MATEAQPSPTVHPLTDDAASARGFVDAIRFDGQRVEVRCGSRTLALGERGTEIIVGMMACDSVGLSAAERMVRRRPWDRPHGTCALAPDAREAQRFVADVAARSDRVRLTFRGQIVVLNPRGAALVLALLAAKPKRVHRAARVFGAEERVGWAEGKVGVGVGFRGGAFVLLQRHWKQMRATRPNSALRKSRATQ